MIFGFRIAIPAILALPLLAADGKVAFSRQPGRVAVTIDGKPFTTVYYGQDWPQPFLHPLRTASGVSITRGYPVEKIEGESQDHIWHHGLWYAHGDINGVDFWRDKGPATTGRIIAKSEPKASGRTVTGRFRMVAPGGTTIGSMEQSFRFSSKDGVRIVDVKITVHAGHGVALKFGDTEEGALGIRFRDEFREDRGTAITNAEGLSGTKQVWGKRAAWVDYTTTVGGAKMGATLFDHPSNPKFPAFWHARGYGLCAINPFGEHDFLKDKARDGSLTVEAGRSVIFRYRAAVHEGVIDPSTIAALAADFAKER